MLSRSAFDMNFSYKFACRHLVVYRRGVDLWWGKVTIYGETGIIYGPQYVFFAPKAYELVTANSTLATEHATSETRPRSVSLAISIFS